MEQTIHAEPAWGKQGIRSRSKPRCSTSTIKPRQEDGVDIEEKARDFANNSSTKDGCDMNIGCGDEEEKARDFAKNSSTKDGCDMDIGRADKEEKARDFAKNSSRKDCDDKKTRPRRKSARIKWFPVLAKSSYPLVFRAALVPRTAPPPPQGTPSTNKKKEGGVEDENIFLIAFTKSNYKRKIGKPPHIPRRKKYIWPKIYDSSKPKKVKKSRVKTERKSKGDILRKVKSKDDVSKMPTCQACSVSEQKPLVDVQSPCQVSTPLERNLVADEQSTPRVNGYPKEETIETTSRLEKKCRRSLNFDLENQGKTDVFFLNKGKTDVGELDFGRKRSRKWNRNGSKYSFGGAAVPRRKRSKVERIDSIIKMFASFSCDTKFTTANNQNATQVHCDRIQQQSQCSTCCNHTGSSKENVLGALVGIDTNERALIPYKKMLKKLIPKVDIDSETIKVWNSLMEKVDHARLEDGNEKAAWWEEERKKLLDRIGTFISCMRFFQGNRRFSKWKGSVTDSIVGVFLTQNVSDVLSSSAFMSLAARFPVESRRSTNEGCSVVTLDTSAHVGTCSSNDECFVEENNTPTTKQESISDHNDKQQKLGSEKKNEKKQKQEPAVNWDELRKTYSTGKPRDPTTYDSVDWEAVRCAPVKELAEVIKIRGQYNILAERIQEFLNRIVRDHGSIDLEWLREVPPEKAKEYLLSITGIGLKSVECIRLLALEHHAFPVDVNVGRIAVRLGWVPLQPLPDNVQIHELNKYPLVDNIQKYLWPRISILDKLILYELHYQLITFGKIFCTKRNPNCKACPMKDNCKYYASKVASEKPRLPEPQKQNEVRTEEMCEGVQNLTANAIMPEVLFLESNGLETSNETLNYEPIIEVPASPGASENYLERDIEDLFYEDDDGYGYGDDDSDDENIPTIILNNEIYRQDLLSALEKNNLMPRNIEDSRALVAVNPEAASTPARKLMSRIRLRTEHLVYELDDGSPLLEGFERREPDDPCKYLLAIWKTGDAENATEVHSDQLVPASILIPSRTANRGSFPLNGTYFQPNEVFADDETSNNPILVPRELLWNKPRIYLYCGSSSSTICTDMEIDQVKECCQRGYFCVRSFNRRTRAPKPLSERFHLPRDTSKKNKDLDEQAKTHKE